MNASLLLLIGSLFYILMIAVLYFSKRRISSFENKIYQCMIVVSIFGVIIDILGIYVHSTLPDDSIIRYFVLHFYHSYLLTILFLFTAYIISLKYNSVVSKFRKQIYFLTFLYIICIVINFMTSVEYHKDGSIIYATGPNIVFLYSVAGFLILCWTIYMIKNIKSILTKKHTPIIMFVILSVPIIMIQMSIPELLLVTSLITFIVVFMYHTIENPDLQMLREFHKQKELAEESNNEKISFLFNLSNDIKEPIMNIGTLCSEALNEESNELVKEDLRKIKSSSNELLSLVDNVLDVSELERRKIDIRGRKYNVYNLFNTINKSFINTLDKNIEYRFNYDNSIPEYLYGDSLRLKQIMNILLDNARDYTKEGFIELNVNHIIKYDVCRLIITVEDSGMGIESEELKHLFDKEKIYSDESLKTIDDAKENLGVLKSLVNLMNGTVMVNSEYGKGSRFTITIDQKIKEEKTKVIEAVEKYEELYENKERVLLVTDEEDIQKEMKKLLKKYDIKLEIVKGGQDCLEKIRNKEKYDMILMEEELPKLSSEDTLIKLNELGIYKTPIIVLTARKEFGVEEELIKKGFSDVIKLPLKKEVIKKVMNKYFEK